MVNLRYRGRNSGGPTREHREIIENVADHIMYERVRYERTYGYEREDLRQELLQAAMEVYPKWNGGNGTPGRGKSLRMYVKQAMVNRLNRIVYLGNMDKRRLHTREYLLSLEQGQSRDTLGGEEYIYIREIPDTDPGDLALEVGLTEEERLVIEYILGNGKIGTLGQTYEDVSRSLGLTRGQLKDLVARLRHNEELRQALVQRTA